MTLEMIKKEEFEEGIDTGKKATALKMLEKGKLSIEEIAEYCELSIAEVEQLAKTQTGT